MKRLVTSLVSATTLIQCANAQDITYENLYFTFGSGAAFISDAEVSVDNLASGVNDVEIDSSYALSFAIGYDFEPIRLELEYTGILDASIDSLESSTGTIDVDGGYSSHGFMLNAIYDYSVDRVTYSIGVGAGFDYTNYDALNSPFGVLAPEVKDFAFTAQVLAGIAYDINDNFSFGVEASYRFSGEVNDSGEAVTNPGALSAVSYDSLDIVLVQAFLTYRF